jgi:uncharacterized tellurite resistance protein B-like protein
MITAISNFFQKHLGAQAGVTGQQVEAHRARLAAATLLVEVVTADEQIDAQERQALLQGIRSQFSLDAAEADELLALAEEQGRYAVDLHQFTSLLNKHFTPQQKLQLIEQLWRAAYADAVLHKHEEHLIRKIADLIYVPHSSMLAAKHRVQSGAS